MPMPIIVLAASLMFIPVSEQRPTSRGCIPGPHELGRNYKMPGTAMMTSRPNNPLDDHYPHCRYDSLQEADQAKERGGGSLFD